MFLQHDQIKLGKPKTRNLDVTKPIDWANPKISTEKFFKMKSCLIDRRLRLPMAGWIPTLIQFGDDEDETNQKFCRIGRAEEEPIWNSMLGFLFQYFFRWILRWHGLSNQHPPRMLTVNPTHSSEILINNFLILSLIYLFFSLFSPFFHFYNIFTNKNNYNHILCYTFCI